MTLYDFLTHWFLSDYKFKGLYQKKDEDRENSLISANLISTAKKADEVAKETSTVFEAVNLSKDLVNLPPNIVTPTYLENAAKAIAKANKKVKVEVLSEEDAAKEKMNSFLAVARGSKEPGKMIILLYNGNPKSKTTFAVVGKGITFDSGGISIKPGDGMDKMKTDMAGSAAALGAIKAVADLGLKVNLISTCRAYYCSKFSS